MATWKSFRCLLWNNNEAKSEGAHHQDSLRASTVALLRSREAPSSRSRRLPLRLEAEFGPDSEGLTKSSYRRESSIKLTKSLQTSYRAVSTTTPSCMPSPKSVDLLANHAISWLILLTTLEMLHESLHLMTKVTIELALIVMANACMFEQENGILQKKLYDPKAYLDFLIPLLSIRYWRSNMFLNNAKFIVLQQHYDNLAKTTYLHGCHVICHSGRGGLQGAHQICSHQHATS